MNSLHFLYGKPLSKGDMRTSNSDFQVQEILPFLPSGEGEHHLLHIRKDGLNTVQVAEMLAKLAKVHPKEVTFAGQKDKNAITEQWFGVRIPGKETPDWLSLNSESITVLSAARHNKKLRIGALSGNRFKQVLRQITQPEDVLQRLELIAESGVPNYFGEQRFGHNGRNIEMARQMLQGRKVKDRNKRSIYLSALRSLLFNQLVSQRLASHGLECLDGDCVMLAGSRSFFVAERWDEVLQQRLAEKDILLSAPMWGRGQPLSRGDALAFEAQVLAEYSADCDGLEKAGLEQERRPLLLRPEGMKYQFIEPDTLELEFSLPAGSFATSVLRELLDYDDVTERLWRERQAAQEGNPA
ncbi:tRNA pseudouridine(13) synthase TruD [Shewanella algae]|uniref:tRNA pseudouridine(13) synthase TruD n=1 Tax=Shewanella algae TaxID=38313 RepID=UPI00313D712E